MRAVIINESFGLDHLDLVEREDPRPGHGELRLRMKAVSLNYRDLMTVRGHYNPKQPLPLIPCSDGVGEVVEVGEGVSRAQVGERVCPIFCQKWIAGDPTNAALRSTLGGPLDGTLGESMVVSEEGVVPVPAHLDDAQAATLPCAALTAWSALVTQGSTKPGDTVLVQGTGGVSIFALQLARLLGARVIVTSSSDEKLERAKELGAWQGINYRDNPKWGRQARELTGGRGVDHVVEVGGAGTLAQSLAAVRPGGQVSVIGVLSGPVSDLNIVPILMQNVRVQGIFVGSRSGFEAMNEAVAHHELCPVVDRTFAFEESREAFEYMASAKHFGKICIAVA